MQEEKAHSSMSVIGDFNIIMFAFEKKGGRWLCQLLIDDFRDCIASCGFSHAGFVGSPYTWCNNQRGNSRILARLDRCLLNSSWSEYQVKVQHLPHARSDHNPLLIDMSRVFGSRPKPFNFLDV